MSISTSRKTRLSFYTRHGRDSMGADKVQLAIVPINGEEAIYANVDDRAGSFEFTGTTRGHGDNVIVVARITNNDSAVEDADFARDVITGEMYVVKDWRRYRIYGRAIGGYEITLHRWEGDYEIIMELEP